MRILQTVSGGKDSVASLLWMINKGYKNLDIVFCDTGWEHPDTYKYLEYLQKRLNFTLRVLKSKKYDGFIDLVKKKGRFPSSTRRYCTSELKSIPMIDYILDEVKDDFIVIQGIRGAESESRSKMQAQCNYFKYYLEPIETNTTRLEKYTKQLNNPKSKANKKKLIEKIEKVKARLALGKEDEKYHTYRRKEVLAYCKQYATDVWRPVFDKSAQWVIDYSIENDVEVNPLYKRGSGRVGCYPCILCSLSEIYQISIREPEIIKEISNHEIDNKSTFFGPDKIPKKFFKGVAPTIYEVVEYVQRKYDSGELFGDENEATSCMSFYGLCE